jgi:hypothetical protein
VSSTTFLFTTSCTLVEKFWDKLSQTRVNRIERHRNATSSRALALQHARAPRRASLRHHTCTRRARDPRSERRALRNVSPATRRVSPRRPDSPAVAPQVCLVPSLPRARLSMHCRTAALKPRHPFAAKAWSRIHSPVYKWHRPSSLAPERYHCSRALPATRHGCRHHRAFALLCFHHLAATPIPPLRSPEVARVTHWPGQAAVSLKRTLQRQAPPDAAELARRCHPRPVSGLKPTRGELLVSFPPFLDRIPTRPRRILAGRAAPLVLGPNCFGLFLSRV